MATITKEFLSGSTNGRGIKVAANATPGTTIHTAPAGVGSKDEVFLYATNTDSVERKITIEQGGTTAPDDNLTMNIPPGETLLVVPGLIINNGLAIKAFGAAANVLTVFGWANRISG
jgi:hypothetical protein